MQPLDVSVFGPLTGQYQHLVNKAAPHTDTVDKALFGTFYAQACKKVLTQAAAQKAFSECGITTHLTPNKVLAQLAGHPAAPQPSGLPQDHLLLQQAMPSSEAAINAALDTF